MRALSVFLLLLLTACSRPIAWHEQAAVDLAQGISQSRIVPPYHREYFGKNWARSDTGCMNTRHLFLLKQSIGTVDAGKNACTLARGKWFDAYTGQTFYRAQAVDIDHLVPLAWAWEHGASQWPLAQRIRFANDEGNLFVVQASINREKGAKGPLQWLPPNQSFHCQYIIRFMCMVKKYKLPLSNDERSALIALQKNKCGSSIRLPSCTSY